MMATRHDNDCSAFVLDMLFSDARSLEARAINTDARRFWAALYPTTASASAHAARELADVARSLAPPTLTPTAPGAAPAPRLHTKSGATPVRTPVRRSPRVARKQRGTSPVPLVQAPRRKKLMHAAERQALHRLATRGNPPCKCALRGDMHDEWCVPGTASSTSPGEDEGSVGAEHAHVYWWKDSKLRPHAEGRVCEWCHTSRSRLWRPAPDECVEGSVLCNACGLLLTRHNVRSAKQAAAHVKLPRGRFSKRTYDPQQSLPPSTRAHKRRRRSNSNSKRMHGSA